MLKILNKILNDIKTNNKVIGGYIFNRVIFNILFFISLLFLCCTAYVQNFDMDYYKCEGGIQGTFIDHPLTEVEKAHIGMCKNPFYKESTWKNKEYLVPGEYGKSYIPSLISVVQLSIIGFLILALLINHILFNWSFKFERKE